MNSVRIALGACAVTLLGFLASCQSDTQVAPPVAAVDPVRAQLMETCGPSLDEKIGRAIDVLASRGFSHEAAVNFGSAIEIHNGCSNEYGDRMNPNPGWPAYLDAKNLPRNSRVAGLFDAINYDIKTGEKYDYTDPAAVARKIPSCYKGGEPYKHCKPIFHPQMAATYKMGPMVNGEAEQIGGPRACRLTADYKRFCAMETSLDGCWSYARGDVIMLPGRKTGSEALLMLARAKRTTSSQPAKVQQASLSGKPQKARASAPQKHDDYCKDDIGFDQILNRKK